MNASDVVHSQVCEDRDFVEWHGGLPWCAVWVVEADTAAVRALCAQGRAALAGCLLPRYQRQPHISVAYRGLLPASSVPHARVPAEFGAAQLQRDLDALRQCALAPFTLQVHGSGSFTTVPYLGVGPQAPLQALHDALAQAMPAAAPLPWDYVPHVTLGHYAVARPVAALTAQLAQGVDGQASVALPVSRVALVRYRTHDIAGPLVLEGHWDLRRSRYQPSAGAWLAMGAG